MRKVHAAIGGAAALVCVLAWWRTTLSRPPGGKPPRSAAAASQSPRAGRAGAGVATTGRIPQASAALETGAADALSTGRPSQSRAVGVVPLSRQDVDRLTDTAAPIERRLAEIDALAERGDEASARRLMALADHDPRLGAVAVAALGRIRSAEAETYLRARLAHPDPQVLAAAVRSLGRVAGSAAVAAIGQTLQQNHRREDGYEDTVCGACVEALGAVGSAAAVPMLAAELERTVGRDLQHEYGSQVVAALGRIGDASARVALLAYADRLRAQRDRQRENPLGRQYLDQKISAVAAAVDSLK